MNEEILNAFIFETLNGNFGVSDPYGPDEIIGYFSTREEAEAAFNKYCKEEHIKIIEKLEGQDENP